MEVVTILIVSKALPAKPLPKYHGRAATLRWDGTPSPLMRPLRQEPTGNPKD